MSARGTISRLWTGVRDMPGPVRTFLLVALVDSVGTGVFLAGAVVYYVRYVGLAPQVVSAGLAAAGLVALLTAIPLGALGDRFGVRRMLVTLQACRAAFFAALVLVDSPAEFIVLVSLQAAAEGAVPAMTQGFVASLVGESGRVRTMALMRSIRNAGFSVGALLAASLVVASTSAGYKAIVLVNAASFAVTAVALALLRLPRLETLVTRERVGVIKALTSFRDWWYAALTGVHAVLAMHMVLLSVVIPLWILERTDAPPVTVSIVVTVNAVLATVLQVPFSRGVEGLRGGIRASRWAGLALALMCVPLALAAGVGPWVAVALLLVGTLALTAGELWQSAGGWSLSYELAPPERRVQFLAVFSTGIGIQDVVGPLLVVALVLQLGSLGWAALAVVFLLATLVVAPVVSRTATSRPITAESEGASA
ncbi:MFS transporter [Cellulomonas xylanilytica]|uniref:Membrane protein n=1 Tax=Cellulomonas xylanilytica TaxID=233583 RepID=A0A510V7U1_9CELL|nr:MFS transporter [Cellulomonas xylanilytica]GEK22856.1 membrane protein [Cellulomonas xylanilytica]